MKQCITHLSAIISCVALLMHPLSAHAQIVKDENTCFTRIASEMVEVHDEWRARLFGSRRDLGSARNPTRKNIALTGGEVEEVWTGIFETKGRLTSELIEPVVESYRVYRCRTLAVCEIAARSFEVDGGNFDLKVLGCAEANVERYEQCYFAGEGSTTTGTGRQQDAATQTLQRCQKIATETLAAERAVVRLAVAYDAGYRSLLQLAGMVDWMLEGFPTGTVKAISDMVNMLGKLHQIPCFIGQCDNPNTDDLTP